MFNWSEKVTVITGAGSGLGQALAVLIASKGGHIALVDVNQKGLDATLEKIKIFSARFTTHIADVSNRERMAALPEEIIAEHKQIDVLFNNAGITIDKTFDEHDLADWDKILGINLWGVIYGYHFFIPYLLQRPESHIATTSSLAGFLGLPKQSSYCLSKAAVRALNESLYAEYKCKNLHITSIHPGAVQTNIFNVASEHAVDKEASQKFFETVKKFAMPADKAAAIIVKAVEKRKQRVRVGKDSIAVDILKRLLPSAVHSIFAAVFKKQQGGL